MANTDNAHSFRFEGYKGGTGAAPLIQLKTDSNLDVALGDPLKLNADGEAALATGGSTGIFGFAAEAKTGATGTRKNILVYPAVKNAVFSGQLSTSSGTWSLSMTGSLAGFDDSMDTGEYEINVTNGDTDSLLRIIGIKPGEDEDDSHPDVLFTVERSQYEGTHLSDV